MTTDLGSRDGIDRASDPMKPSSALSLHLVGPGNVGQAFLRLLPDTQFRLIGVSDSTGTIHSDNRLEPLDLADHKAASRSLTEIPSAEALELEAALDRVRANVVIDAMPTDVSQGSSAVPRSLRILERGAGLVFASKDTLCLGGDRILADGVRGRVGINAALGGTGRALMTELSALRRDAVSVALVANASTTAVIQAIEAGLSTEAGIRRAQDDGLLEPDPELDLSGRDAAVKLVGVVRALWGHDVGLDDVDCQPMSALDMAVVQSRVASGNTTRLVGRASADGDLSVAYEEMPRSSALAVPCNRVAYSYLLRSGGIRVHVGTGLGPLHTAAAVLRDVEFLAAEARQ